MTNDVKVHKSNNKTANSGYAEKAALIFAMQYAFDNNINQPMFFTDRKDLAKTGIAKNFLNKFNFRHPTDARWQPELHWIPRELNKEADKIASKPPVVNSIQMKTPVQDIVGDKLRSYSLDRRINLLQRLAKTKQEMEMVILIKEQVKAQYNFQINKDTKKFQKFINTIISYDEMSNYTWKRLNKKARKDTVTEFKGDAIENFIRSRNLI